MSIVTAKAFRQQIMKPAEGLFLFHARAIERLIEGQLGERLAGFSVPDLPYYLMPRADFLLGLETENAEALSVIEGLELPDQVILLPSPPDQRLEHRSFTRLRHDYWARAFEAEVARAWQAERDCSRDDGRFSAHALRAMIGRYAFAEIRDVLDRDGLILPIWDDDLVSRSFVALIVRLRYFAPGARGFFFPAIHVWPDVDRWLVAGGLDLPRPLIDKRLPRLLRKSRPGGDGSMPADVPLLPIALPYGRSDPDLAQVLDLFQRPSVCDDLARGAPKRAPGAEDVGFSDEAPDATMAVAAGVLEQRCLDALSRGTALRTRPGWVEQLADAIGVARTRLLSTLRWVPSRLPRPLRRGKAHTDAAADASWREGAYTATLAVFEQIVASAQRAYQGGHFALALWRLAAARRKARRLLPRAPELPARVEAAIGERERAVESALAEGLSARWSLDAHTSAELRELVERLAAVDRARDGSPAAQGLLGSLEQLLLQGPTDYYRLRYGRWLTSLGRSPLREPLPFQPMLKALRALENSRLRLEELLWPIGDLERFSAALQVLNRRITDRLDVEITPSVQKAMREADFVPRNHREVVAAHKMQLELLDVIKHRRHLKFTDVRDIVARNILRLPDPTLDEFFRGDRLRRFDRTAERALPGVYRPGELYIKGLQQLGAPLFGTSLGRDILRYLLLPFGGAFLVLKSLDLLAALMPFYDVDMRLTQPTLVILTGALANLFAYTGIGRHLGTSVALGVWRTLRFATIDGPRELLHWWPVAALLNTGLMRGVGRNLVQPLLIGIVPLAPIIALAVFVDEVPIQPGLWLFGLAFALGTLARNTPAGRRFLDNLSTRIATYFQRINQALFIGLIQQLLYFFKEVTRRFSQLLHRVDDGLTHHVEERWPSLVAKAVLAPVWRLSEALMQFYVTVLVEPQVNPVKHFPIVTIGHKLLLPFLPAITAAFVELSESILPKVVAYPLVTITIVLLPGLFGFLVWELKENWKLYEANHRDRRHHGQDSEEAGSMIEPASVGSHGETMRGLMRSGFHTGTLPKSFSRLRRVIRDELRDGCAYPKRLRRSQRQLEEVEQAVCVFVDREFSFALRERCRDPNCTLARVETSTPRLATEMVEVEVALYARAGPQPTADVPTPTQCAIEGASSAPVEATSAVTDEPDDVDREPVWLGIRIAFDGRSISFETELSGGPERIDAPCWAMVSGDLTLFAGRAGADLRELEIRLPESAELVPDVPAARAAGGPLALLSDQIAPRRDAPVPG